MDLKRKTNLEMLQSQEEVNKSSRYHWSSRIPQDAPYSSLPRSRIRYRHHSVFPVRQIPGSKDLFYLMYLNWPDSQFLGFHMTIAAYDLIENAGSAVMATKTLRRSLVDGKTHDRLEASDSDDLNEPLLGDYECSEEIWNDERRREQLHWTLLFTHLIAQWARWLANIVLGSGSLIGRLLASATQNAEMKFRTNGWHVFRTHTSDQTAKPAWNSAEAFRGMHAE